MGMHGYAEHERPHKDQRGDPHNPPEIGKIHVPDTDHHDFGIDVHTGKKRIKMKDIKVSGRSWGRIVVVVVVVVAVVAVIEIRSLTYVA